MSTTTTTTTTIVTKPQRFCAGYYVGTITAGGLTIDYCLERCDVHNSHPGDSWAGVKPAHTCEPMKPAAPVTQILMAEG